MYESESNTFGGPIGLSEAACKRNMPQELRVRFVPVEDFEKGKIVGYIVDGVLCTQKEAAIKLLMERFEAINQKWDDELKNPVPF